MHPKMRTLLLAQLLFLVSTYFQTLHANLFNFTTYAPALWTKNDSLYNSKGITEVQVRAFLFSKKASFSISSNNNSYSYFACGFYCNDDSCRTFLFGIFITIDVHYNSHVMNGSQFVWSANRNHPVQENATMQFMEDGNLVLCDFDGSLVWPTGTKGKLVTGMTLLDSGIKAM